MRRILVQDLPGAGEDPSVHRKSDHVFNYTIYSFQHNISQDCYEVARCEVAQLSESPEFPTMASMLQPFVTRAMAAR